MISKRLLQLALVALSTSQVAQAHYVAAVNGVVARGEDDLVKRQSQSSSATSAPGSTTRPSSTTNAPAPSTTTTNRPTTTTESPRPTPTSESPRPTTTTSNRPQPSPSSSSESEKTSETTTSDQPRTTSTIPPQTSTIFETVTNTDGSVSTKTSESVTPAKETTIPLENTTNNNTGMTPQTRNTIIGVVVGVGGAIILAVIGLFAYRMWGRKKAQDENDGLMDYGTPGYHPGPAEPKEPSVPGSSSVGTGRSPFQSTLESYHAPTQVNTASNF